MVATQDKLSHAIRTKGPDVSREFKERKKRLICISIIISISKKHHVKTFPILASLASKYRTGKYTYF